MAIFVIVFLLPACIICAIYIILGNSTIKRSKEMLQEPVKNENLELIKVKLKESFFKLYICLETGKYFSQYTQQEKPCFWK